MPRKTRCRACWESAGITNEALFMAGQSMNQGIGLRWIPVCQDHADYWNDGGDWIAPVISIQDYKTQKHDN